MNKSLKVNPTKAVAIEPIIKYSNNFLSLSKIIFKISFLNLIKITKAVPKCNRMSYMIGTCKLNKCCIKAKCPELDIGNHSVIP